jgi:hypothetical protein
MLSYQLLPNAFSEIFVQATTQYQLTLADRYGLTAALCSSSITDEEKQAIDRILYGVRRGHIQVVPQLSAVQPGSQFHGSIDRGSSLDPNCFDVDKLVNPVNP